jgi:hypothetical protein
MVSASFLITHAITVISFFVFPSLFFFFYYYYYYYYHSTYGSIIPVPQFIILSVRLGNYKEGLVQRKIAPAVLAT